MTMPSLSSHGPISTFNMMPQNPMHIIGNDDVAMDGLANLQPETVELPDLKDYQTLYQMDQQDHIGKENDAMNVMMSDVQVINDLVGQEAVMAMAIDNQQLKDAPKEVS